MTKIVDARGLACPQPVILTRKALRGAEAVTTIVDSETAATNVSRMATREGWAAQVEEKDDGIYLHLTKEAAMPVGKAEAPPAEGPTVLFVAADAMGRGPEELGSDVLIRAFFHTLNEVAPLPDTLIFINTGVKLVVDGSPVVADLQALIDQGVEIQACGTCLNYFGLMDKVAVGQVSNMYTIAETLLRAGRVVSF